MLFVAVHAPGMRRLVSYPGHNETILGRYTRELIVIGLRHAFLRLQLRYYVNDNAACGTSNVSPVTAFRPSSSHNLPSFPSSSTIATLLGSFRAPFRRFLSTF